MGATVQLIHDVKSVVETVGKIAATAEVALDKNANLRTGRLTSRGDQ
jgi:nitronate monooxygenase